VALAPAAAPVSIALNSSAIYLGQAFGRAAGGLLIAHVAGAEGATPCWRRSACRCSSRRSAVAVRIPLECALTLGAAMFKEDLLKGKRILITGGGTGLGKEIAARYLQARRRSCWIAGRRGAVLDSSAKELVSKARRRRPHAFRRHPRAAAASAMGNASGRKRAAHGARNNAAGNFISRPRTFRRTAQPAIANIVFHGTFYVTQAVGQRWIEASTRARWSRSSSPGCTPARPTSCPRRCRRPGARDDEIARGRMGPLRHPAQRESRQAVPDRGRLQAAAAGTRARSRTPRT